MKHTLALFIALLLSPPTVFSQAEPHGPGIDRIWLGHRSRDPGKLVVNWMSKEPGDSIVRFGRTANYGQEVRVAGNTTIHHVEIPLEESDGVYHYSVRTGNQSSKDAAFKAYPSDELRVVVAADWQSLPDLSAIRNDDVHLLLTAGDNISNTHQLCGPGNKECVKSYARRLQRSRTQASPVGNRPMDRTVKAKS
ncbi:MAG: hypothetical protein ACYTGL_27735 [Planctomycetota bacterium]|jgi:hypothetical protein